MGDNDWEGDVLSVKVPGRTMIILNTFSAARDLLDKQSAQFSDRPYVRGAQMFVFLIPPSIPTDEYFRSLTSFICGCTASAGVTLQLHSSTAANCAHTVG